MLKAVQGFEFSAQAPAGSAQMVISDGANRYVVGADGSGKITASAEETREWAPGKYSYQILSSTGIEEEGALRVKANFLISADPLSYWRKALKAVEDRIAGKTLDPANDVTVGDKRISYYRLDELLRLRDFILQKMAEEDSEDGEKAPSKSDQKKILYTWRSH